MKNRRNRTRRLVEENPFRLGRSGKTALLIEEYRTLRDEILKRMEMRSQLVIWGLIGAGAFASIVSGQAVPVELPLLFPLIALALAWGWMHQDIRIDELGTYIARIEKSVPGVTMWESWKAADYERKRPWQFLGASQFSALIAFLTIAGLAVVVALARLKGSSPKTGYLILDGVLGMLIVSVVVVRPFLHFVRRIRTKKQVRMNKELRKRGA